MKQFRNPALLAGFFLCATVATGQVMYTVTPLKLVSNPKYSVATAINNQGQVVGWSSMNATDSVEHAFLYSNGVMNDLGTFGGNISQAKGLNNNGEVVGIAYYPSNNLTHAFYYHGGAIIDLTPGSNYHSEANSINDSGQIAGGYNDPNGTGFFHAFLYQNGTLTDLAPTDGTARSSSASQINASGQVVGRMLSSPAYNQWYGFLWSGGVLKTFLPIPSGDYNQINGMNDAGLVVGAGVDAAGTSVTYPFLYNGNSVTYLFSTCGAASQINNASHVVGYFYSADCWTTQTGFLFNGSTYTYMYPLGASGSNSWLEANAINRFDQVGGKTTSNVSSTYRAFVAYNGVVSDLNTLVDPSLKLALYNVDHINDSGLMTVSDYYNIEYLLTPVLSVTSTHAGSFAPGQQGATYSVTVTNAATAPPTNGTITVTETVPAGITLVLMNGNGWTCPGSNTCTRTDSLSPGASYPPITVTVNVAGGATSPQVNWVSVSEGSVWLANSSDSTAIQGLGVSTTTAFNVGVTYSPSGQNATLTANVASTVGAVNGGTVTFSVVGFQSVTSGTVTNGNASATLALGPGLGVGSYAITATFSGTTGIAGSSDSTKALLISPATPVITWHNPPDMQLGSALGSGQLDAAANFAGVSVPGTYVYSPKAGTVLQTGSNITLTVQFTPLDTVDYLTASGSAVVNVVGTTNQYTTPNFVLTHSLSRGYNNGGAVNCPDCVVVTATLTNIGGQPPGAGNSYPSASFWVGTEMGTTPPWIEDTVFTCPGPPSNGVGNCPIPPGGTAQAKAIWLGSGYPSGGIALLTIWTYWTIDTCGSGPIIPNACYWSGYVGGTSRVVLP
jgi:probable HAF family extracellular repeat protein